MSLLQFDYDNSRQLFCVSVSVEVCFHFQLRIFITKSQIEARMRGW